MALFVPIIIIQLTPAKNGYVVYLQQNQTNKPKSCRYATNKTKKRPNHSEKSVLGAVLISS